MDDSTNLNTTQAPIAPPPPPVTQTISKVKQYKLRSVPPKPVLLFEDWFFQTSQTSVKYNQFQYLKESNITHILCLTESDPNYLPKLKLEQNFQFKLFPMKDAESFPLDDTVSQILDFIEVERKNDEKSKFVVHCLMGVSRSVAIACACIMKWNHWSYEQAIEFIRERREGQSTLPNQGFVHYLQHKLVI